MSNRNYQHQGLHDKVIISAQNYLNKIDFDIYINPGSEKNAGVGNLYPDIILTKKGKTTVKFFIEVETADSINLNEAQNQWKKYARGIRASFYLLVPTQYRETANRLCKQVGISVRFGTFDTDYYGNVSNINWE